MPIELKNITKRFGKGRAIENVSLTLPDDKILGVLGPSGSGKSTLLRLMAGLETPDEGKIVVDGEELIFKEPKLIKHRQSVGVVFQQFNLFPHLTALENITYPLIYVHHLLEEEAKERALSLLKRFRLDKHAHKKPAELSGGQNQRVAILRAIAIRPKILLFDEPTSALDPIMTAEVLNLIAEIKHESTHFILITHHVHFAKTIADTIAFMSKGRVIEVAQNSEFFAKPKSEEAQDYLNNVLIY
jgi:polar amino acid transport system ATP-binding protein